jgi:hypothetical protein
VTDTATAPLSSAPRPPCAIRRNPLSLVKLNVTSKFLPESILFHEQMSGNYARSSRVSHWMQVRFSDLLSGSPSLRAPQYLGRPSEHALLPVRPTPFLTRSVVTPLFGIRAAKDRTLTPSRFLGTLRQYLRNHPILASEDTPLCRRWLPGLAGSPCATHTAHLSGRKGSVLGSREGVQ